MDKSTWDVAIVGGGIGGLTAGALLARDGAKVVVCEQHSRAGGFCHSWSRAVRIGEERVVFTFDSAVHDISGAYPTGPVHTVLGRLGLNEGMEWHRVSHEYLFPFGSFAVDEDHTRYVAALKGRFPAEAAGLDRFFGVVRESYDELMRYAVRVGGLPVAPRNGVEMRIFRAVCPTLTPYIGVPFVQVRDALVGDPDLREVLSILSVYVTDDVAQLSFANMLPLFGFYLRGGHYPRGGSQAMADALAGSIEGDGGAVRLRAPVERILVRDGRACGLRLKGGEELMAGSIISNADPIQTFGGLVGADDLPGRLSDAASSLHPANSAFMLYLALDVDPPIASSTIVMRGREGVILSRPPYCEDRAPDGYSTLTLTELVGAGDVDGWDRRSPGYKRMKRDAGDRLIALASARVPDLAAHIVHREEGSPETLRRFCRTSGAAAYGATPGTRWRGHGTPIRGLYVVGAWAGLGPGVEAVMIGGATLAELIISSPQGGRRAVETSEVADG
jgi:all-trans-retinol 13,14-reductase